MSQYPPNPAPSNGLGIAGFIVSLLGIFTAGVLSPIGLLLSLIALLRRPRGFAFAGFIVGLVGTAILALWLLFFGFVTLSCINLGRPMVGTLSAMQRARVDIQTYQSTHGGALPSQERGDILIAGEKDAWGNALHYLPRGSSDYQLQSAGPAGLFGTSDDLFGP
jgi:hypothetical protein